MLNLTHLKVLDAVARHGSVTEAAKELNYSQPSVSHHLGRLEAATGAKLIQRMGRPRRTECRTGATRRFPNGPQHPRAEGSRRAVPVAPGNRAEPRRCAPGRGPDDAAIRT